MSKVHKFRTCGAKVVDCVHTELGSYILPPELGPASVAPGKRRLKRQLAANRSRQQAISAYGSEMDRRVLKALFP